MACLGGVPWAIWNTYRGWTSIDMCKQKKQKYLLKVWGSLCAGYFSPLRKIPLQFALTSPSASDAQPWDSILHPGSPLGWLRLAEQGQAMGVHCSQRKHCLQGLRLLQTAQPQPCTSVLSLPCAQTLLAMPHMLRTWMLGLAQCCFFHCRRSYFRNLLSHSWHGHPRHQGRGQTTVNEKILPALPILQIWDGMFTFVQGGLTEWAFLARCAANVHRLRHPWGCSLCISAAVLLWHKAHALLK